MSHREWADATRTRGFLLGCFRARSCPRALSFIALQCLLWSPSALAQTAASGVSCAPSPAPASASSAQQVAILYRSFECHFARKEYAACLPYLQQACRLTDSPRCLLNQGAVHHALMHCQLARGYYREYLDRAPYDEDVAAARGALLELERACPHAEVGAEVTAALAPAAQVEPGVLEAVRVEAMLPTTPPPLAKSIAELAPPATSAHDRRAAQGTDHVLAWSLLGAGGASLAATVTLAAFGARAERDYEARARQLDASERATDTELRAIDERGHRSNRAALVLGVLSGLLGGAGATLWLAQTWQAESDPGASLQLTPDGAAALSYAGSF